MENLKAVLGPNPLLWLWPQPQTSGDGLSFPITPDAGGESAYEWAGVIAPDQQYNPGDGSGGGSGSDLDLHSSTLQARLRGHLRDDSMVWYVRVWGLRCA
jgi:hypothetical protein